DVALLGASYTSFSARRAAEPMILQLRDPGGPARGMLEATTLGILAMDEAMYLRSVARARDLARRALAAGLPLEPHRGGNWAVLAGLDRDETPESLRQLIDRSGIRYDTEFLPSSQLRYASGVLRAAAGNHAAAVEELLSCELEHPTFGGENPAVVPWRSAAAL